MWEGNLFCFDVSKQVVDAYLRNGTSLNESVVIHGLREREFLSEQFTNRLIGRMTLSNEILFKEKLS